MSCRAFTRIWSSPIWLFLSAPISPGVTLCLFQRLLAAKEKRGTRIIVIDPRATPTAEAASLHLPLAPGSDVALLTGFSCILKQMAPSILAMSTRHTSGFAEALQLRQASTIQRLPGKRTFR